MKKQWYVLHRWLGAVSCLAVLVWCVSGFLHPVMSWTQPRPRLMAPKAQRLEPGGFGLSPAEILNRQGINEIEGGQMVFIAEQPFLQVKWKEGLPFLYFNPADGTRLPDGDQKYAVFLARTCLGEFQAPVSEVVRLTEFDRDYRSINRLLPVYKVVFDRPDGMAVYVDPEGSRISTLEHRLKRRLSWTFGMFHNWEFLGAGTRLRVAALVFLSGLTLAVAVSGLVVYGLLWKRLRTIPARNHGRNRLKRYHRILGLAVSVVMMLFSFSGGLHAFEKPADAATDPTERSAVPLPVTALRTSPDRILHDTRLAPGVVSLNLVQMEGRWLYRVTGMDQSVYCFDPETGALVPGAAAQYPIQLATGFSGLAPSRIVSTSLQTQFDAEYGFINKRLPVVKVQYRADRNPRLYVDPVTGVLAARFSDGGRSFENFTFTRLHKWQFLDSLTGKMVRDVLMMLTVSGMALVAGMGLVMFGWLKLAPRPKPVAAPIPPLRISDSPLPNRKSG
ncbi:MAG: PepSY domain-containing protein [Blastocatellia bacterium]|nr:PepSY domain-containing protein [Blastocatellia bacterium]